MYLPTPTYVYLSSGRGKREEMSGGKGGNEKEEERRERKKKEEEEREREEEGGGFMFLLCSVVVHKRVYNLAPYGSRAERAQRAELGMTQYVSTNFKTLILERVVPS